MAPLSEDRQGRLSFNRGVITAKYRHRLWSFSSNVNFQNFHNATQSVDSSSMESTLHIPINHYALYFSNEKTFLPVLGSNQFRLNQLNTNIVGLSYSNNPLYFSLEYLSNTYTSQVNRSTLRGNLSVAFYNFKFVPFLGFSVYNTPFEISNVVGIHSHFQIKPTLSIDNSCQYRFNTVNSETLTLFSDKISIRSRYNRYFETLLSYKIEWVNISSISRSNQSLEVGMTRSF